jgi:hypothetical protein
MDLEHPPETYWHCSVSMDGKKGSAVVNDLRFEDLKRMIVDPWHAGRAFSVSGVIIRSSQAVAQIKITWTKEPKSSFENRHNASMRNSGVADMATDRRLLPIWKGEDCTYDLLFSGYGGSPKIEPDALLIEQICQRLPHAARILSRRSRQGRVGYEIADEYDVQDLLHGILRAFIKYSVQEDPLPKAAGAKSSRADISIEDLGILIEIKYVHRPDDQKRIFEEYSQDLVLYAKWPHLKTLVFLIYNSGDLRDAEAFEKLSGSQQVGERKFEVRVVLA